MSFRLSVTGVCAVALGLLAPTNGAAQNHKNLITGTIDENRTVAIHGNVRPEVTAANDRGARAASTPLTGMQLVLHRSPENQAAFDSYLAGLNDSKSPNFHKFLTNAQIGMQFGPSSNDLRRVSQWLTDKGFVVHPASPDGSVIEFDGDVRTAERAFKTSIHNLHVKGQDHFANITDPEIPEALTGVVSGVASLNDFMPHVQSHRKTQPTAHSNGVAGNGYNYLSAADLATIYNFTPLFAQGITGKGITIAIIEDTDQYSIADWQVFRKQFGLARAYPYGSLVNSNPTGSNTCTDPGVVTGDDVEASIDVDWATAAAPNAALINAGCRNTSTTFGGFLALANLLQSSNPPKVVSISYGEAETELGATYNAYIATLYSNAAAQGVSIFVSSGDEGAASVDANRTVATRGIAVSGFASTPYNIAVGGTDFGNIPLHDSTQYFNSTNLANYRTALSYIPEIPWNGSCASSLLAAYFNKPTSGSNSFCNTLTSTQAQYYLTTGAGSGGPSGCATGTYATGQRYVVGGTCKGYAKPSWQSLVGVPADGVRDIPDVSLFASNGVWGAYYAVCNSNPADDDTPCTGDPSTWPGYGGTSVSAPIWAGIQALVNQSTGTVWGNSNQVLYSLARTSYGAAGNSACNSSSGTGTASNCVFYDVTQGDIAVDCAPSTATASKGTWNCYNNGGTYGVLSTDNSTLQPAYPATTGYDLATGIGTTNATNLVNAWTNYSRSF